MFLRSLDNISGPGTVLQDHNATQGWTRRLSSSEACALFSWAPDTAGAKEMRCNSVGGTMEFARMENGFYEKLVQSAGMWAHVA